MSDKTIRFEAQVTADTSKADQGIDKLEQKLDQLTAAAEKVNKTNVNGLENSLEKTATQAGKTTKEVNKLKASLKSAFNGNRGKYVMASQDEAIKKANENLKLYNAETDKSSKKAKDAAKEVLKWTNTYEAKGGKRDNLPQDIRNVATEGRKQFKYSDSDYEKQYNYSASNLKKSMDLIKDTTAQGIDISEYTKDLSTVTKSAKKAKEAVAEVGNGTSENDGIKAKTAEAEELAEALKKCKDAAEKAFHDGGYAPASKDAINTAEFKKQVDEYIKLGGKLEDFEENRIKQYNKLSGVKAKNTTATPKINALEEFENLSTKVKSVNKTIFDKDRKKDPDGFRYTDEEWEQNRLKSIEDNKSELNSSIKSIFLQDEAALDKLTEKSKELSTSLKPVQDMAKRISQNSSIKDILPDDIAKEATIADDRLGELMKKQSLTNQEAEEYITLQTKISKLLDKEAGNAGGVKASGAKDKTELETWIKNSWRKDANYKDNYVDAKYGNLGISDQDTGKKRTLTDVVGDAVKYKGESFTGGYGAEEDAKNLSEVNKMLSYIKENASNIDMSDFSKQIIELEDELNGLKNDDPEKYSDWIKRDEQKLNNLLELQNKISDGKERLSQAYSDKSLSNSKIAEGLTNRLNNTSTKDRESDPEWVNRQYESISKYLNKAEQMKIKAAEVLNNTYEPMNYTADEIKLQYLEKEQVAYEEIIALKQKSASSALIEESSGQMAFMDGAENVKNISDAQNELQSKITETNSQIEGQISLMDYVSSIKGDTSGLDEQITKKKTLLQIDEEIAQLESQQNTLRQQQQGRFTKKQLGKINSKAAKKNEKIKGYSEEELRSHISDNLTAMRTGKEGLPRNIYKYNQAQAVKARHVYSMVKELREKKGEKLNSADIGGKENAQFWNELNKYNGYISTALDEFNLQEREIIEQLRVKREELKTAINSASEEELKAYNEAKNPSTPDNSKVEEKPKKKAKTQKKTNEDNNSDIPGSAEASNLDALSKQLAELKEAISGNWTSDLSSISSVINELNISEVPANNMQALADALERLKSVLTGVGDGDLSFLNSITELTGKGDQLKNLAEVLKSSKKKIEEATKATSDTEQKERGKPKTQTQLTNEAYSAIAKNQKAILGVTKTMPYNSEEENTRANELINKYQQEIDLMRQKITEQNLVNEAKEAEYKIANDVIETQKLKNDDIIQKHQDKQDYIKANSMDSSDIIAMEDVKEASEQWEQAVAASHEYKDSIGEIADITRQVRKSGEDYLESYRITGLNGNSITVGKDGNLINSNTDVLGSKQRTQELKDYNAALTEYSRLSKKGIKDGGLGAEDVTSLKNAKETIKQLRPILDQYNTVDQNGNKLFNTAQVEQYNKYAQRALDIDKDIVKTRANKKIVDSKPNKPKEEKVNSKLPLGDKDKVSIARELVSLEEKRQKLQAKVDNGTAITSEASNLAEITIDIERHNEALKDTSQITKEASKSITEYKAKYDELVKNQTAYNKSKEDNQKYADFLSDNEYVQSANDSFNQIVNNKSSMPGLDQYIERTRAKINDLNQEFAKTGNLEKYTNGVNKALSSLNNVVKIVDTKDISKQTASVKEYFNEISNGAAKAVKQSFNTKGNPIFESSYYDKATKSMVTLRSEIDQTTGAMIDLGSKSIPAMSPFEKIIDGWKGKMGEVFRYLTSFVGVFEVWNAFKQGVTIIKEFDTALTEMRKVSEESVSSLKNFQSESFGIADSVGTTALQIQNSTADFLRLGDTMDQAKEHAKDANILLNVSEFENIDDATSSLIAMSKAYDDLSSINIIDKLNNVGNNFAIGTDGLATALQVSASALKTAKNDADESIALITAGNQITQDPDKVGAGLRTIALRLTGTEAAKQELEDAGEDVSDFTVTTSSKLNDQIEMLTKTTDKAGVSLLDMNGNYRSTYEIVSDIADRWEQIAEEDLQTGQNRQNALLEMMAGKNRANILASMLESPEILKDAYNTSKNSDGSAQEELDKQLESIEAKMQQFKNAVSELAFDFVDSSAIKGIVDFGTTVIQIFDGIIKHTDLLIQSLMGIGLFKGGKKLLEALGLKDTKKSILKEIRDAIVPEKDNIVDDAVQGETTDAASDALDKQSEALNRNSAEWAANNSARASGVASTEASAAATDTNTASIDAETGSLLANSGANLEDSAANVEDAVTEDALNGARASGTGVTATNTAGNLANAKSNLEDSAANVEDAATEGLLSKVKSKLSLTSIGEGVGKTGLGGLVKNVTGMSSAMLGGLTLVGAAITASIYGYKKYQEHIENCVQSTKQAGEEFASSTSSLQEQMSTVEELKTKLDSGTLSEQDAYSAKSQLLSIQQSLTSSYGDQAANLDLVNGKLETQLGLMQNLSTEDAEKFLNGKDSDVGIDNIKSRMEDDKKYTLGLYVNPEESGDVEKEVKTLVDSFADKGITTDPGDGGQYNIRFTGDATQAESVIGDFLSQLRVLKDKYADDDLATDFIENIEGYAKPSYSDAEKLVSENEDAYKQILEAEMTLDNGLYNYKWNNGESKTQTPKEWVSEYKEAVDEYNNALVSGEGIDAAKSKFTDIQTAMTGLFNDTNMGEKYGYLIAEISNQLDTAAVSANDFRDALNGKNTSDTGKNIKKYGDELKSLELSDIDFKNAFDTKDSQKGEDVVQALVKSAQEAGIVVDNNIQPLIDILTGFGMLDEGATAKTLQEHSKAVKDAFDKSPNKDSLNQWYDSLGTDEEREIAYTVVIDHDGADLELADVKKEYDYIASGEKDADATISTILNNTEDGNISAKVDAYTSSMQALNDATDKLNAGGLSDSDLAALIKQFPELGNNTDNLKEAIVDLQDKTNAGIDSAFASAINNINTTLGEGTPAAQKAIKALEEYKKLVEGEVNPSILDQTPLLNSYNVAKSTANSGDKYKERVTALKELKEMYDKGLVGTDDFKTGAAMFSPTASTDPGNFIENYNLLSKYFNEDDASGVKAFLNDLESKGYATLESMSDGTQKWTYSMDGLESAAKNMHMPLETFMDMFKRLDDYGFSNDYFATTEEGTEHLTDLYGDLAQEQQKLANLQSEGADTNAIDAQKAAVEELKGRIEDTTAALDRMYKKSAEQKLQEVNAGYNTLDYMFGELGKAKENGYGDDVVNSIIQDIQDRAEAAGISLEVGWDANEESIKRTQKYIEEKSKETNQLVEDNQNVNSQNDVQSKIDAYGDKFNDDFSEQLKVLNQYKDQLGDIEFGDGDYEAGLEDAEKAVDGICSALDLSQDEATSLLSALGLLPPVELDTEAKDSEKVPNEVQEAADANPVQIPVQAPFADPEQPDLPLQPYSNSFRDPLLVTNTLNPPQELDTSGIEDQEVDATVKAVGLTQDSTFEVKANVVAQNETLQAPNILPSSFAPTPSAPQQPQTQNVEQKVTVSGTEEATSKLASVNNLLNIVNNNRPHPTITVNDNATSVINSVSSGLQSLDGKVSTTTIRTVHETVNTTVSSGSPIGEVNGTAHVLGTAHADGTVMDMWNSYRSSTGAYAGGNWSLKNNETALVNELGTEGVVFFMPPYTVMCMKKFI